MYTRKTRTEYEIARWSGPEALQSLLNHYSNKGWMVDFHKVGNDDGGWTAFKRHIQLNEPLLERSINVGMVYHILNSLITPVDAELARLFDDEIKAAVKQEED